MRKKAWILWLLLISLTVSLTPAKAALETPFTIEYYYKVKWGYSDEWLDLYKRNHWPVLLSELKDGYITGLKVEQQRRNLPEEGRWDLRVSITYRDIATAHHLADTKREATLKRLYPDHALHEREERRRFELLEGLWDVEVEPVNTKDWPSGR